MSAVQGVHLCGSVPLASADDVFRVVGEELGGHVRRIPDGETGERAGWIGWAAMVFWRTDGLEEKYPFYSEVSPRAIGLADGVSAADIVYPNLEYADAALAAYERFAQLKAAGSIPADVRFQVSLPTPVATVSAAVAVEELPALEPGYEAAMLGELQRILDGIPHDQLAIQWDVCLEVWFLEGNLESPWTPVLDGITERLVRYAAAVPDDVEMGYHLCYGDYQHEHLAQPADVHACVDIVNGAVEAVEHRIDWVHIPVPIDRDDDAFFAPLDDLRLPEQTELYLGLVHFRDGADGARRRIETGLRHVSAFGVATECGMGRRQPERGGDEDSLRQLLGMHAAVADAAR